MAIYIAFNLVLSVWVERSTAAILKSRGIHTQLVVASPRPLTFWRRGIAWRSADRFGNGSFDFANGLQVASTAQPLRLDDPHLLARKVRDPHLRAFLVWSRMPIVVRMDGHDYLTDQRFYSTGPGNFVEARMRRSLSRSNFFIPLD